MKTRNLALPAVSLAIGGTLGALMGGGFIHGMLSYILCKFIGIPVLIILAITGIQCLLHRGRPSVLPGLALGCATLSMAILGFAGGGVAMARYRESDVRRFVEQVLPLLDSHKMKHGAYPQSLEEVTDKRLPHYLKGPNHYTSNGATFTFYYEGANSVISGLMLTDSHRKWCRAD
jgi:hypothetical protein